jgi:putative sterol carrier protein
MVVSGNAEAGKVEGMTIARLMELMPKAFRAEMAEGVDSVIQFVFTGDESGEWYATLRERACIVTKGTAPAPTLTLTARSQDYLSMIAGTLNPMAALAQGRIKLKGDIGLAMKMTSLFEIPD